MTSGHIFEVTSGASGDGGSLHGDPAIVWEYVCPITGDGLRDSIDDQFPMYNSIFRAYRYGSDFPAFAGKRLSGDTTIAGRTVAISSLLKSSSSTASKHIQFSVERSNASTMLHFANLGSNAQVSVYSVNGRLIERWSRLSANNLVLQTNRLSTGLYLCRITTLGGTQDFAFSHLIR
jgi:hypothetical protein